MSEEVYFAGSRVRVDESGNIVGRGRGGRPVGTGDYGEPTVRISVPVSAVPAVEEILKVFRLTHKIRLRCLRSVGVSDPCLLSDLLNLKKSDNGGSDAN